jgi:hypothetical protein
VWLRFSPNIFNNSSLSHAPIHCHIHIYFLSHHVYTFTNKYIFKSHHLSSITYSSITYSPLTFHSPLQSSHLLQMLTMLTILQTPLLFPYTRARLNGGIRNRLMRPEVKWVWMIDESMREAQIIQQTMRECINYCVEMKCLQTVRGNWIQARTNVTLISDWAGGYSNQSAISMIGPIAFCTSTFKNPHLCPYR